MSGRVDEIVSVLVPFDRYTGGLDGNTSFALRWKEVGGGTARVHGTRCSEIVGFVKYRLC